MTITNGYATLAEYKAWITMRGSSTSTDAGDDAVIEDHIEAASRYIDRETGKRFFVDSVDKTRYYTPTDSYELDIDPLSASPTSVSIDSSGVRSYTALTEDTDFELMPYNAALEGQPYTQLAIITALSGNTWPLFTKSVKVVGKFGYPSVPHDVREATLALAQSLNASRSGQVAAGKVTVTASGVVIRPEEVPAYTQRVIKHYRSLV